jgi:predicted GH43/DUF377 family glycosyl hydrolase
MMRVLAALCVLIGSGIVPGGALAAGGNGWAAWTKRSDPVFEGQYVASDPAIVRDGDGYRMFYTCFVFDPTVAFDPATTRAALCEATSPDGLAWTNVPADGPIEGLVLTGREGSWDENLEGSFAVERGGDYLLYYSGYRQQGTPAPGFPAALAVARSHDGLTFARVKDGPILRPTPGWYDTDAVYSPTIVDDHGKLVMIYAGHCYTGCKAAPGVTLLAATSTDGLTWTKRSTPVLQALPELGWTRDGVAEPGLIEGPDGLFYLFFTGLRDADRVIGIARGTTPFGPWEVDRQPIVVPSASGFDRAGVLAPDVVIEGDTVRMWFLGTTPEEDIAIGYAEATWPLWRG